MLSIPAFLIRRHHEGPNRSNTTKNEETRTGRSVTDGPFAETKELVGGYALVEAKSKEAATKLATQFMEIHRVHWPEFEGFCEVRRLEVEPG